MRHLFIINPSSGKGKSLSYIPLIHELFDDKKDQYVIEITKYPGHASEIVGQYIKDEDFFVYAVGGDGTLNEIANILVNTNNALGVIPCGTGNDFIRSFMHSKNYKNILERTVNGKIEVIDTAKANNRYFVNIASIGFDSNVVYNARIFKKKKFIPSSMSYLLSLFYTPFKFKSIPMNITIDNITIKSNNLLFAVCNGSYYGGGIPISPHSSMNDGILDICMVKSCRLFRLLRCLPKALSANHTNIEEVSFYKGNNIHVQSNYEFIVQADGELTTCNDMTFEFYPNSLRILKPQ